MQPSEGNRQLNKDRYDALSIPGYVIKKNPTHGARHGPSMRECMYSKAHDMLRKARKHKSGGHETILERWNNDGKYRKSLSDVGSPEEGIIQYYEIALEDYSNTATREERSLHENSWKLSSNAEGANGPLNQRDDFKDGQETCKRLYHEHTAITGCGYTPIPPQQQVRQSPNQQFEGHDEKSYRVDSSGWTYYVPATTHSSSSPSSWWQPSDSRWSTWN